MNGGIDAGDWRDLENPPKLVPIIFTGGLVADSSHSSGRIANPSQMVDLPGPLMASVIARASVTKHGTSYRLGTIHLFNFTSPCWKPSSVLVYGRRFSLVVRLL